jgi:hypothetical protein
MACSLAPAAACTLEARRVTCPFVQLELGQVPGRHAFPRHLPRPLIHGHRKGCALGVPDWLLHLIQEWEGVCWVKVAARRELGVS